MQWIRIRNLDGLYLADDSGIRWTADRKEAAEYDSERGANLDIEGEGLMECDIVTEKACGRCHEIKDYSGDWYGELCPECADATEPKW